MMSPVRVGSRATSIKPVKMMDRAVTVPDIEAVGRRDRRAHPGLGISNGGFQRLTFRKEGGDGG